MFGLSANNQTTEDSELWLLSMIYEWNNKFLFVSSFPAQSVGRSINAGEQGLFVFAVGGLVGSGLDWVYWVTQNGIKIITLLLLTWPIINCDGFITDGRSLYLFVHG